jgi:membrane protease subunit HflK
MAWNEPDNDDRQNDPWGSRSGRKDQGPPDIDKVLTDLMKKLTGLFGGGRKGTGSGGSASSGGPVMGIIAILVIGAGLIWVGSGFYTLDEQERGVVMRLGRAQEAVVMPGLHWNPPLVDDVIPVNVTRVYDRSFSNTMLTQDDNIVDITMTVQYVITDARKYVLEVEDPELSLQEASESAIRHVVGGSPMDDVISTGREALAVEALERLQRYLDLYGTGITVSQFNIAQSLPPQQVRAAFDDVIKAREDNQSYQNEARRYSNQVVPEARGFAQRQTQEATAYKEQVVAEAQGEASRFEQLLVEYQKAPGVTRERMYIDTLQTVMTNSSKIMIDVEGGNNMMYLPLDQILQNSRRNQGNVSVTELELPAGRNLATESQSVRPVPLRGSQR